MILSLLFFLPILALISDFTGFANCNFLSASHPWLEHLLLPPLHLSFSGRVVNLFWFLIFSHRSHMHHFIPKVKWSEVNSLSRVRLFSSPWTVAYQAPPMEFFRQKYWSGLPLIPKDFPYSHLWPAYTRLIVLRQLILTVFYSFDVFPSAIAPCKSVFSKFSWNISSEIMSHSY